MSKDKHIYLDLEQIGVFWQVGYAITDLPENFNAVRMISRAFKGGRKITDSHKGVDRELAEAVAFETSLAEGKQIPTFVFFAP